MVEIRSVTSRRWLTSTNLRDLHVWSSEISDVSSVANLTQLTRLELQNNQIADVSPLADLANLKDVMLLGNLLLSTAQSTIDVLEAGGTTVSDDILLLPLGDNNTLRLDGDGDYVEIPDSPSLDVTGNITLECWVNVNEITHESGRLIVKTWAGDKNPWMVYGLVREGGAIDWCLAWRMLTKDPS